jgi:hypothetical protein
VLDVGKSSQSLGDAPKEEDGTRGCRHRQKNRDFSRPNANPKAPHRTYGHDEMHTTAERLAADVAG